jgi:Uma2 family endonuclease
MDMSEAARKLDRHYTWADYRRWPDGERWEIIDGVAYAMTPSPASRHQMMAIEMAGQMFAFFRKHKCRLLAAPMDVRLSDQDVVQPDLLVVCHRKQIQPTHIEGAPALVVEILSPATQDHDRVLKTRLYARAGVKEYWILTPFPPSAEVLVLDGDTYRLHAVYGKDESLVSAQFPGLQIALPPVFDFPLEPHEKPRVVKESPRPAYGRRRK